MIVTSAAPLPGKARPLEVGPAGLPRTLAIDPVDRFVRRGGSAQQAVVAL